ncbi:MAG: hypothetical protein ABII90_05335 [Bacteroidota bacterium]
MKTNADKIILELIKKIKQALKSPKKDEEKEYLINDILLAISKIKCRRSVDFLAELLDDYMNEISEKELENNKRKYVNLDFFHLLDCLVKQQDKKAIPHIIKARDFFPENYTDYLICQIAAGRIKKGTDEGCLHLEALEITFPTGKLFEALSHGEMEYQDNFEENYDEYLTMKF